MASSSLRYWKNRSVADYRRKINLTEDYINNTLEDYYSQAQSEIKADIAKFYQTFADQNNISLSEAKRTIRESDLSEVDFEELSRIAIATDDPMLHAQLNALSKKSQITRLEMLDLQINAKIAKLFDKEQIGIFELLVDTFTDSYYRGIYNTQQFAGIG